MGSGLRTDSRQLGDACSDVGPSFIGLSFLQVRDAPILAVKYVVQQPQPTSCIIQFGFRHELWLYSFVGWTATQKHRQDVS